MKKAVYAIMCVALIAMVFSCGGDEILKPKVETFTGEDAEGTNYTLIITNDTYVYKKDGESVSTGTAVKEGDTWICTPFADPDSPFEVTVSGNKIITIKGEITPDDGGDPVSPPAIIQIEPVAGVWTWALSDDENPNPHVSPQTIFAPGGSSRFTAGSYVEDPVETDRYDKPVKRPFVYPAGTVEDNEGNIIEAEVYNFKGTTQVSSNNRPASEGARFPILGWEAVPDGATRDLLREAFSYSFWIRLNSATKNNWAFVTAVFTDYEEEKGYEHKHWFGNQGGDSGGTAAINNFTKGLKLGAWYKITVVIKKDSPGFNINRDKWMYLYVNTDFANTPNNPKVIADKAALDHPYDQSVAEKLQWQIPLQHQVDAGVNARSGDPYDIMRGSYTFDVDFYGLELNMN